MESIFQISTAKIYWIDNNGKILSYFLILSFTYSIVIENQEMTQRKL
jgi:hypothetical protein